MNTDAHRSPQIFYLWRSVSLIKHMDNPNTRLAEIFVDELARSGLKAVCVAPGSRSTPLTLAFAAHPAIAVYPHLDERSAAFFALGLALADGTPAAVLCTSGTAAANFFPAAIEARQSQVPLLLLTADRPPELRQSGANQTIDQVKLFGDQVLWFVDVPLPEVDAPEVVVRHWRTLAARAYHRAAGLVKGPVHLNFPFRKPLEPGQPLAVSSQELGVSSQQLAVGSEQLAVGSQQPGEGEAGGEGEGLAAPFTRFSRGVLQPAPEQVAEMAALIEGQERGLIVCGPRCPGGDFPAAVAALSRQSGYPILADPVSGVRFGPHVADTAVLGGYDTYLAGNGPGWPEPEVIIRFGDVPTSNNLNGYLERVVPQQRLYVNESGRWADDSHRTTAYMQVDPAAFCRALTAAAESQVKLAWRRQLEETENTCWQALAEGLAGEFFDAAAVADLVELLPADCLLFAGNSLPIRHLDQFGRPSTRAIRAFANRGASGIDGNISTALGLAATIDLPLVLLIGDITFYHDMNGLLAATQPPLATRRSPITIVLLNNGGGGIFHRLPVSAFEPPFTRLFITPHGLDFEAAARLYGFDFARVTAAPAFREAFSDSLATPGRRIIEVKTDSRRDFERRQALLAATRFG
jgi:2-succinyl-5-enolpyruvyl-6-hydroxy-3-cyclohexene-1-carboxylate synthase